MGTNPDPTRGREESGRQGPRGRTKREGLVPAPQLSRSWGHPPPLGRSREGPAKLSKSVCSGCSVCMTLCPQPERLKRQSAFILSWFLGGWDADRHGGDGPMTPGPGRTAPRLGTQSREACCLPRLPAEASGGGGLVGLSARTTHGPSGGSGFLTRWGVGPQDEPREGAGWSRTGSHFCHMLHGSARFPAQRGDEVPPLKAQSGPHTVRRAGRVGPCVGHAISPQAPEAAQAACESFPHPQCGSGHHLGTVQLVAGHTGRTLAGETGPPPSGSETLVLPAGSRPDPRGPG